MFTHRTTNPEFNNRGEHLGFTHLTINDHHGVLNPELTQEDVTQIMEILTPFFHAPDNVDPAQGQDPRRPLGMYIPQENLQEVNDLLDQNAFQVDAVNRVRNIMAITVNIHTTIGPHMNACNVVVNIISDYVRRED